MWAESSILEQLPNGGAVVAIIAVVMLYLKRQEKSEETIRAVVETFTAESKASRDSYQVHIAEVMRLGLDAHRETREAIRSLDATIAGLRDAVKPRSVAETRRPDGQAPT